MKKILRLLRNSVVFICWTILFTFVSNNLMDVVWNFNFMSAQSWQILNHFWNEGGVLKTSSDVLLIITLLLLPFFWFIGFIVSVKLNYLKIIAIPFSFVCRLFNKDDNKEPERIVIKNIKSSQQMIDDIKAEIESIKPEKSKEAGNIRSEITKRREENKN